MVKYAQKSFPLKIAHRLFYGWRSGFCFQWNESFQTIAWIQAQTFCFENFVYFEHRVTDCQESTCEGCNFVWRIRLKSPFVRIRLNPTRDPRRRSKPVQVWFDFSRSTCPCQFAFVVEEMYFLGGRYYRHRHNTHYICKWYYPLKKKDPSLITGYQMYREEIRERIAKSSPHLSTRGILKQVRRSWKLLPENQKDDYRRREITEQHPSERCRSTLAFRKGTKPSPSTLISYSDHSAW